MVWAEFRVEMSWDLHFQLTKARLIVSEVRCARLIWTCRGWPGCFRLAALTRLICDWLFQHCTENPILFIPINETAKPRSQFLHSCICERFIENIISVWDSFGRGYFLLRLVRSGLA